MKMQKIYDFDVALSFAGEDRQVASELNSALSSCGVHVFYDLTMQASLWGKDLYQHLQEIYRDKARYCVVLVSEHYVRKLWTRHELKQAQARAFQQSNEYILPVRLDDTALPGLNSTVGFIDLRATTIPQLAALIMDKLGIAAASSTLLTHPKITGLWEGAWASPTSGRQYSALIDVPDLHDHNFSAQMTVSFEVDGQLTVVRELLDCKIEGNSIAMNGQDFEFVQRGAASSYATNCFTLSLADEGTSLCGRAIFLDGVRPVSFTKATATTVSACL